MGYHAAPQGWWREFVAADPAGTAKPAVVRADRAPQVVPVWVALDETPDGVEVVFNTGLDTVILASLVNRLQSAREIANGSQARCSRLHWPQSLVDLSE